MKNKLLTQGHHTLRSTGSMLRQSLKLIVRYKLILMYPLAASLFLLVSLPVVNSLALGVVSTAALVISDAPLGLDALGGWFGAVAVVVTILYAALVSAFFTCLISAAVFTRLKNPDAKLFSGAKLLLPKWRRVVLFGILSPFFGVIYLASARPKGLKEIWSAITTTLSINTALVAPGIVSSREGVTRTLHSATSTLGEGWKEQLLFKVILYIVIALLALAAFLPAAAQDTVDELGQETSQTVRWIVATAIWLLLFVATKVISGVFTTVLYHHFQNKTTRKAR